MAKYDQLYMDIARRMALQSYAERRKVGCVVVQDGNIISFGWNGMPAGMDNTCEEHQLVNEGGHLMFRMKTKPVVSHAEMNALGKLIYSGSSARGATLYCTAGPCLECAKLIQRSGITEVVFEEDYRLEEGLRLLEARGINFRRLTGGC